MKKSTKIFIGYIALLFIGSTGIMLLGKFKVEKELEHVLENADQLIIRPLDSNMASFSIWGPFDVVLHQGSGESVVTGPEALMDDFVSKVEEGKLRIQLNRVIVPKGVRMKVDIYTSELSYVELYGGANLNSADSIRLAASAKFKTNGNSDMNLMIATAGDVRIDSNDESDLHITGLCNHVEILSKENSTINLKGLLPETANVKSRDNSDVFVEAAKDLNLNANGNSTITYLGTEAKVTQASGEYADIIRVDSWNK
ncbi:MAG: DUF2807 domain-containing protein [Bacteroidia bacterium]